MDKDDDDDDDDDEDDDDDDDDDEEEEEEEDDEDDEDEDCDLDFLLPLHSTHSFRHTSNKSPWHQSKRSQILCFRRNDKDSSIELQGVRYWILPNKSKSRSGFGSLCDYS